MRSRYLSADPPNPSGRCLCGCGGKTKLASQTSKARGWIEGTPMRFIQGHGRRKYVLTDDGMKRCNTCGEHKPLSEYHAHSRASDGYKAYCKVCAIKSIESWKKRNPEAFRATMRRNNLFQNYRMTEEQYNQILESQNGVCAVCRQPEKHRHRNGLTFLLAVDHDHTTGKVRGLLCADCNRSLGLLKDSVPLLQSAIRYLKRR